jgi:hypothetical protein
MLVYGSDTSRARVKESHNAHKMKSLARSCADCDGSGCEAAHSEPCPLAAIEGQPSPPGLYPFVRSFGAVYTGCPRRPLKRRLMSVVLTFGGATTQRNHDHRCSKSLAWADPVYILQMILTAN